MATIRLRFRGSSLIAAYGVPYRGSSLKLPAAPRQIYKGPVPDPWPAAIRSCRSSLRSSFVRVCVNRVAARLAPFSSRERALVRFPWSHCRRQSAKEVASLIGIPNRSPLLFPSYSPSPVLLTWNGALYFTSNSVCMMRTNWSDGAKIFHLFLRFFHRGSLDGYDNGISIGRLSSEESVCSTVREFNYGFIVIFFDRQIGMLLEVVF